MGLTMIESFALKRFELIEVDRRTLPTDPPAVTLTK